MASSVFATVFPAEAPSVVVAIDRPEVRRIARLLLLDIGQRGEDVLGCRRHVALWVADSTRSLRLGGLHILLDLLQLLQEEVILEAVSSEIHPLGHELETLERAGVHV